MAYPRKPTQTFKPERGIVHPHQQAKNTLLSFITLSLIFAALLFAGSVKASAVGDLNKRGEGEMSYLFWTLYSAEFYATPTNSERALKLEYYRSIDSKDLVDATEDQWNKLGYSNSNIQRWLKPLYAMWPNVEEGSTLTIRVAEDNVSRFYFDEQPIGIIQDKQFGEAFLAIWLSENTSEPALRKQLLGLNK
ncbi:chalcone isomerase family protein [Vibrio splendidus]|uniref:chalcone isomerase family protein n=1 Tax=Vibrio splendidus TaxID=29497 RepID=UPI00076A0855|nr:chalcone isomerase family protein [Vibrio splendidus]